MASSKNSFSKDCCIVWLVLSGWFSRKIRSLYTKYSPLSFSLKCELLFKAEISFHKMKFSRGLRGAYESWEIITSPLPLVGVLVEALYQSHFLRRSLGADLKNLAE